MTGIGNGGNAGGITAVCPQIDAFWEGQGGQSINGFPKTSDASIFRFRHVAYSLETANGSVMPVTGINFSYLFIVPGIGTIFAA